MQKFKDFSRGNRQSSRAGDGHPKVVSIKGEPLAGPRILNPEQKRKLAVQKLAIAFEQSGFNLGYISVIADEGHLGSLEKKERETVEGLIDYEFQEALKKARPEQIEDLAKCVGILQNENHANLLANLFCEHLDDGIIWLPFVKKEVVPYTSESGTEILFAGDEKIDNYISRFKESAISFIEAERRLGLSRILPIFSGRKLFVEISHEEGFSTFPNGAVNLPSVCWEYEKKEHNLEDYKQGTLHELSHHRYKSFRVNLHPEAFDYEAAPFDFVEIKSAVGESPCIVVEHQEPGEEKKRYEISKLQHLYALVEKPMLLKNIWNILDDRRIDFKHVEEFPGSAQLYEDSHARAIEHVRKEITDEPEGAFEAFVQVAITGRTKNPIPPGVNKMLQEVWKVLGDQELDAADTTDTLACAFKIHKIFCNLLAEKETSHTNFDGKGGADVSEGNMYIEKPKVQGKGEEKGKPEKGDSFPGSPQQGNQPGKGKEGKGGEDTAHGKEGEGESGTGGKKKKRAKEEEEGRVAAPKNFGYDSHSSQGKIRGGWSVVEITPEAWDPVRVPNRVQARVSRALRKVAKNDGVLINGQDSGDPDIELLAEHRRLRKAGVILPPDYYSDVWHIKRSVLMGQLIDFSGSMSGEKITRALSAAKALEGGANLLRDDVITMGFGGSDPVEMCALGWPGNGIKKPRNFSGATPLGGALRHMAARMQEHRRKHRKKLVHMMVITDGQPNVFPGQGWCSGEDNEAVHDSAQAVKDARKLGIKMFGLIILDKGESEAGFRADYDKIFGRGQYYILRNIEYLPAFLQRYYRRRVLKQGER